MKVNLSSIDRTRFYVHERQIPEIGPVVLITSHKAMWNWAADELRLRSLLCRPNGEVVSSGFPKFFNFGENQDHDRFVAEGMKSGSTRLTEKVDGSLIIRSVIDGKVNFRTRGCEVIAADIRNDVEELIREKYPELLSPSLNRPNHSFLMEYISPKNQIVVQYQQPELVGLGWIDFSGQELVFHPIEDAIAGVRKIREYPISVNEPDRLRDMVQGYTAEEGVVTWTQAPGTTQLCKFKSNWYLRLHALRSQVTPRYLKGFCIINGIDTFDQLKDAFYREGFDWETVIFVEPTFNKIKAEFKAIQAKINQADAFVSGFQPNLTRKDIALAIEQYATKEGREYFGYMIAKATGKHAMAEEIASALQLDMNLAQFRAFVKAGLEKLGAGEFVDE